jgi:hypothetical protein
MTSRQAASQQQWWATPTEQGRQPQVPSPDGSPCIREECQRELAGSWQRNQNGPGYACNSCYTNFGTGKKAKAAADPKQLAITQFFKRQKQ